MPRGLQEILAHADGLGRRFEDHQLDDVRTAAPLRAIREAVTDRAAAERGVAEVDSTRTRTYARCVPVTRDRERASRGWSDAAWRRGERGGRRGLLSCRCALLPPG